MKNKLLENLRSRYQAQIDIHKTNIDIFLTKSIGVADHINFAETVEKELENIARYRDLIEALDLVNHDTE